MLKSTHEFFCLGDTFEDNLEIKNDSTKYLRGGFDYLSIFK